MDNLIVLASSSPRRMDMLRNIGLPPLVHPVAIDETPLPLESPQTLVARLSKAKAKAVAHLYPNQPVLGADTVVFADGSILGKPAHEGAARQMIQLLSGRRHQVFTGYDVQYPGPSGIQSFSKVVMTEVEVKALSDAEITAYLRSQEWRGKAGGYALQGKFSAFVRGIYGNYDSVVGLPICLLLEDLAQHQLLPKGFPSWTA